MVGLAKGLGCKCCGDACFCENENAVCEYFDPFDSPSIRDEWIDLAVEAPGIFQPPTIIESDKAKQAYVAGWGCNSQIQLGKTSYAVNNSVDYQVFPTLTDDTTIATFQVKLQPPWVPEIGLETTNGAYEYFSRFQIREAWGSHQELGRGSPVILSCTVGMLLTTTAGQLRYQIIYQTSSYGTQPVRTVRANLMTPDELTLRLSIERVGFRQARIRYGMGTNSFQPAPYENIAIAEPCKGFNFNISSSCGVLPDSFTKPNAFWNDFSFTSI